MAGAPIWRGLLVIFRHVDEHAQLIGGGEVEEFLAGRRSSRQSMSAPTSVLRAVITPSKGA